MQYKLLAEKYYLLPTQYTFLSEQPLFLMKQQLLPACKQILPWQINNRNWCHVAYKKGMCKARHIQLQFLFSWSQMRTRSGLICQSRKYRLTKAIYEKFIMIKFCIAPQVDVKKNGACTFIQYKKVSNIFQPLNVNGC